MTTIQKSILISTTIIVTLIISITAVIAYQNSDHNNMMHDMDSNLMNQNSISHTMNDGSSMGGMDHSGMDMAESVKDDKSFIEHMIPHHQEAVDTSKIIQAKSNDEELKAFARDVISAQEREIEQMKIWYGDWFDVEYADTGEYILMMGDLNSLSGTELDKSYTKGMIMHHKHAIEMAEKIQKITEREEIKQLANDITTSQNQEVIQLNEWLMSKYNDHSMMGM